MAKVRELVGEMATIQMEYGESFWQVLRPVQHARGLTATPHTIYDVNALGIEIGESVLGVQSLRHHNGDITADKEHAGITKPM